MKQLYSDAEIDRIKARVDEILEDAEAQYFALQAWLTDWRIRQAEKRRAAQQDA